MVILREIHHTIPPQRMYGKPYYSAAPGYLYSARGTHSSIVDARSLSIKTGRKKKYKYIFVTHLHFVTVLLNETADCKTECIPRSWSLTAC